MSEREEEQSSITVKDRRKFNLDGSIREGFEAEAVREIPAPPPVTPSQTSEPRLTEIEKDEAVAQETTGEEDIPGADDPASFVNFLSTLVSNAAASLGAMPHPVTGKRTVDLDTGRYWLEVLAMIKDKTKGNLHPKEAQLLDGILGDLKMQYVQLMRATEEKLKQQAASKFSASDMLGRKK